MEEVLSYLVSTAVTAFIIAGVVLSKKGYDVLKEKANELYDANRNTKVAELLNLVIENIDDAVQAFLLEHNLVDVTEADIQELIDGVKDKVTTLTGNGVISYLMSVFVDNWDEWIHEKVLSRLSEFKNS